MPELNFDKVISSLKLRLESIKAEEDFENISKEYLGKDSLLSEERKKLKDLSNEDKKRYGQTLTSITSEINELITKAQISFKNKYFENIEKSE